MITIAILDDGICSSKFPSLGRIDGSIAVEEDGTIVQAEEPDQITHGTLCAAIIRSYAPDAKLISVKVLDPATLKGSIHQIRYALEWCISQNVSLINLSVGSVSFKDWELLRHAIAELTRKNIPLICACSNNETPSIFTEFTWPISVEKDSTLTEDQYYYQNGNFFESDFRASSTHTLLTSENTIMTFSSQNSHAAPVITAKVYQLLKEHGKLPIEKLRRLLRGDSTDISFHIKPIPDFMDTVIIIGQPQYPEDLCFFSSDARRRPDSSVFLAFFPDSSFDVKQVKETISSYGNDILGVLYAGVAPREIKEIAYRMDCLFWDESEYIKNAAKLPPKSGGPTTINLLFRGDRVTAAQLAQSLQKKMISCGYCCQVFSDWPQAYCLGMLFLPPSVNRVSYINSFVAHYQLDVALVCSDTIEAGYDMVLSCGDNFVLLEYDSSQKKYWIEKSPVEQIAEDIFGILI